MQSSVDEQLWQLDQLSLVRDQLYHPTVYLWVDKEVFSEENRFNHTHFSAIGETHACTSVSQAKQLIQQSKQLFRVITSASLGVESCRELSPLDNVIHIYIFCQYMPAGELLKNSYSKVKFVANNLDECLRYIVENRRLDNKIKTLPNFITINSKDRSLINTCRFNLHHLLSCSDRATAKQDFARLAHEIYPQDEDIGHFLSKYEYDREKIFQWYTLECFYYKLLNNILRCSFSPLTVGYVRLPFADVFRAVRELYKLQKPSRPRQKGCEKFYRSGWITQQEFQSLRNNQKGFIEIMGFLSTSKSRRVAEQFLKRNPNESTRILYTVKVYKEDRCPEMDYGYVDISQFSKYQEEEVLFNALNVFQVSSVRVENGLKRATLVYGSLATYVEMEKNGSKLDPDQLMMVLNSRYQKQAMNRIKDQGDLLKACEMYDQAIRYKMRKLASTNPANLSQRAQAEISLGECYARKGLYAKALTYYRLALEKLQKLPNQTKLLAEVYDNLGRCTHEQGNYKEALVYTQKSIDATLELYGEEHEETAVRLGNLGVVQLSMGNYQRSVQLHEKSQKLCLKLVGEMHLSTATSYNNMGSSLHGLGQIEKAIECYNKCLTISEAVLGNNNKDIATVYNNLGLSYHKKQQYQQAVDLYNRSLDIKKSKSSTTKSSLSASYINLGLSQKCQGNYQSAIRNYQLASQLLRQQDPNHPTLAICYNNLGQCLQIMEEFDKAVQYYKQALAIIDKGDTSSATAVQQRAHILGSTGLCSMKLGKVTEGRTSLFEALKLFEQILGKDKCKENRTYKLYLSGLVGQGLTAIK